jgi:hypothetical protein
MPMENACVRYNKLGQQGFPLNPIAIHEVTRKDPRHKRDQARSEAYAECVEGTVSFICPQVPRMADYAH